MEINETYYPDRELLARYFAGESSAEEITQLETWRDAHESNAEALFQWQTVWIDTGTLRTPEQFTDLDHDRAFAKVKARKEALSKTKPKTIWWQMAAAAVVLIAIGWLGKMLITPKAIHEIAGTEMTEVKLTDGTTITLKPGSELAYESDFGEKQRVIQLSGEAFFEVAHNPQKPFQVQSGDLLVTVLGTSFNIKPLQPGYEVAVTTGRVQMQVGDETLILAAGEKGVFSGNTKKLQSAQVNANGLDTFWKSRKLHFSGETLAEVTTTLAEAYGVNIVIENDQAANCHFSGVFEGESIDQVLEVIALSQNLTLIQQNNVYKLTGQGCATF